MRLVFHLGFPRTGTTFLQKNVFPLHKQINFLGPKNYHDWNDVKITQDKLNNISELNDDYTLEKSIINDADKDIIKFFDKDKLNLISSERYTINRNIINNFRDCKYLEILLKQNYDHVKIDFLVVLRNQYDLLKSYYYHSYPVLSKTLNIRKFKRIINLVDNGIPDTELYFNLNFLLLQFDFFHLHKKLKNKFKNSKIKYLYYEDLKNNKTSFSDELSDFLNLEKYYTTKLLNSDAINQNKYKKDKIFYKNNISHSIKNSQFVRKICESSFYNFLKNTIPFKNFIKKKILDKFVFSTEKIDIEKDDLFRKKIKEYYKSANIKFFSEVKIKNKYNY